MERQNSLEVKHYMVFEVASKKFALDILDIDSVHTSKSQSINDNIEDLRMAVRLYKRLVPIISLRTKFNLESDKLPERSTIIFLKQENAFPNDLLGIQVDCTNDILEIIAPKVENKKPGRLIKTIGGLRTESVQILRISDIIENEEHVPIKVEVLN